MGSCKLLLFQRAELVSVGEKIDARLLKKNILAARANHREQW